jgi:hypothetical protein
MLDALCLRFTLCFALISNKVGDERIDLDGSASFVDVEGEEIK